VSESAKPQSTASKLVESFLVGTVEAIARAGAKAVESLTSDAAKTVRRKAGEIDAVRKTVEAWRKENVGEIIDGDLPPSLREEKTR
jgi:hypothetical protein